MALELQIMLVEVSGATVRLVRGQGGRPPVDIYREDESGREVVAPSGYEVIVSHARFGDPEQALVFAEAVRSVAARAIHLRSLEGDRL